MPLEGSDKIVTPELNFPKGGGTIQGLGESVSHGGMLGIATLSIPLPLSPARSFTPSLALSYSSGAGNSPFGLGFFLSMPSISRRTSKGVPVYTDEDEFLDLSGETLVPDTSGKSNQSIREITYQVSRFYPRVEGSFNKIEFWQGEALQDCFWRVYQSDGTQHLFGKTADGRISDPKDPQRILRWLLEESVSVNGEHILYLYKPEDTVGVDLANPAEKAREHRAEHYLKRVFYANREGSYPLYRLGERLASGDDFLFELVFDYGEHGTVAGVPQYAESNAWPVRLDSFSDYSGGFEIRTHRLCRQVLMFHRFAELAPGPVLVASLVLRYHETPLLTQLEAAYQRNYSVNLSNQPNQADLPPIEFKYQDFTFDKAEFERFEPFADLPGLNDGQFYQLVDLYGEGLPGILYRDGSSTLYRAPQRAENAEDRDAIDYAQWEALPTPVGGLAARSQCALMDLTGDGQLDWVIAMPGMAGFFSLDADKNWRHFIPFSAFPTEFNHPRAYLANIMGAGLSDLILIGPNSVRLYANQRDQGFSAPFEVEYDVDIDDGVALAVKKAYLPSANVCETEVIAFSDVLGSGQQHLVRVRYNEVVCWPNLGRGEFGKPIRFADLPFSYESFRAKRVFLADVDGSGATDLLYVESDHIKVFLNQSGNGLAEPYLLSFPPSVRYDDLAQVSFADVWGNGSACLVLTLTHPKPEHWVYNFNAGKKSYLLEQVNNNRGLNSILNYRSSAQEWLDEKKEQATARCRLPFPVQLLSTITQQDEISESQFQQRFFYRQGYYDGVEREFRGFAYVGHYDCENFEKFITEDEKASFSPPLLTKMWYHTGSPLIDHSDYYQGDPQAIVLGDHRYLDKNNQVITLVDEIAKHEFWHALRGSLLRQEIFSVDKEGKTKDPFSISSSRYQVRVQQEKGQRRYAVLLPSLLEQLSYQYDEVPQDPRCDHQINMTLDRYGMLTEGISIQYPRRGVLNTTDPYFDEEQFVLRLQRSFLKFIHLDEAPNWRLGLPYESRVEATAFSVPIPENWRGALSYEKLAGPEGLLTTLASGEIIAWSHEHYWSPVTQQQLPLGVATAEGLIAQVFVADIQQDLLKTILSDIPDIEDPEALEIELVTKGGYASHRSIDIRLPHYYWIPSDQPSYNGINYFFRIDSQRDPFANETHYQYDAYSYTLVQVTNAVGHKTTARYNYQYLKIWETIDPNELTQQVAYDLLGRVIASTFRGYEKNSEAGFNLLDSYNREVKTLEEILANPKGFIQKVASVYFYDPFSWMPKINLAHLKKTAHAVSPDMLFRELHEKGFITQEGYVTAKSRWHNGTVPLELASCDDLQLDTLLAGLPRTPPHAATLLADQYADKFAEMQVRISVAYIDGFDRNVQTKQLVEPGDSYLADENGELLVEEGALAEKAVTDRWVVSERIDYNNKGLPVRKYQAYFIDTYRYVRDTALQKYGYYDCVFYDALGREFKLVNAAGFFQRYTYHPWFLCHEDENDTWAEVLEEEAKR
jgi:Salmonella virulence plasmid 65kDa B protein/Insecticide toxin TcdB middle/C-terminal region/Insecticide toxin TcdB middle/N-terminal region